MKKLLLIFCIISLGLLSSLSAQVDEVLKVQLEGKNRLDQIMPVVERYYGDPVNQNRLGPEQAARRLKKWKRWEWYISSRLGPNGEFVNVSEKTLEASKSHSREFGQRTNRTESSSGDWDFIGPNRTTNGLGRADRVVFHPSSANTMYAGSPAGGLWESNDGGGSWSCITERIPSMGISGIAINPSNPQEIFILTGDGDSDTGGLVDDFGYIRFSAGVMKCTDGGASGNWTKVGAFPGVSSTLVGYQLVMAPGNPNILLAATSQGLFRTGDGGATWTQELTGRYYDVIFKPGSSSSCYAVTSNSFRRSVDGGLVWQSNSAINTLFAGTSRIKLAVSPANNNFVYVLCGGGNTNGQFNGLFRSVDSGVSFNLQNNQPCILGRTTDGSDVPAQVTYDLALSVDPTNANRVIAGAIQAWRSSDGGVNWVYKGSGVHDDIHDLAYNPLTGTLWAASDGGMYASNDDGNSWDDFSHYMPVTQFYRIAVSPVDVEDILGGAQDNGLKFRNGNTQNFEHIRQTDGYTPAFDPDDATTFYCTMNSNIWKFDYDNDIITLINPANSNLGFFSNMTTHPSNGNTIYLAEDSFWKTTNGGTSWNFVPNVNGGWFLRSCPSNGNRLYMAGGVSYNSSTGILRRSDDGGATWPPSLIISNSPDFPDTYPKITSINVNPTNSLNVYITFGGFTNGLKALYSPDGGVNWTNISYSLPNVPANTIAIDNNNNAYIGTDIGVFYKAANASDWIPFYNWLPYVPITDLVITQSSNRIRAATFGRGIYESDLRSACATNLIVTTGLGGQKYYEASNSITSSGTLAPDAGTKIAMQAGNMVRFTPPFKASRTAQLKAYIGPCGGGGVPLFRMSDSTEMIPFRNLAQPHDDKSSTPFANVEVIPTNGDRLEIKINNKIAGSVHFVVTNEEGRIFTTSPKINVQPAASYNREIDISGLPTGSYYVHIFHDDRWVHFQELLSK